MSDDLDPPVRSTAEAAGLSIALSEWPEDVAAAAAAAHDATAGLRLPDDPVAEPWPPMRVGFPT